MAEIFETGWESGSSYFHARKTGWYQVLVNPHQVFRVDGGTETFPPEIVITPRRGERRKMFLVGPPLGFVDFPTAIPTPILAGDGLTTQTRLGETVASNILQAYFVVDLWLDSGDGLWATRTPRLISYMGKHKPTIGYAVTEDDPAS